MLGRSRETRQASDQGVVLAVSAVAALGQEIVEAVGRPVAASFGDVDAECSQSRRRHCHEQRSNGLTTVRQVGQPVADEIVTWEVVA